MTSSLVVVVAQQSWIALRGSIPTAPIIWMLTTALYAWIVPSATGGGKNCSSDDGDGDGDDDHAIRSNDGVDDGGAAAAAGQEDDDDDIVGWETIDHDDNESNNFVDKGYDDEKQKYNPTGLQIWPNGKIYHFAAIILFVIATQHGFSILSSSPTHKQHK